MPVDRPHRRHTACALLVLLAGCGGPPPPSPAQIAARAATLRPGDAHLAELYERSCKACHAEPRANAPLAGDRAAWQTRLVKGRRALLESVLTGINGMPAGGQCFTCTPQDYEALIRFMADEDSR
jgi:cytochrome c5